MAFAPELVLACCWLAMMELSWAELNWSLEPAGGACEHGVEHRGTSGPGVGRAAGSSPGLALDLALDQAWTKTKPKTRP